MGLETNLEHVTSNPIEQKHSTDSRLRDLPVTESIIEFIQTTVASCNNRLQEVEKELSLNRTVVQHVVEEVINMGKDLKFKCDVKILSFDKFNQICTLSVTKKNEIIQIVTLRAGTKMNSTKEYENPLKEGEEMRWFRFACSG